MELNAQNSMEHVCLENFRSIGASPGPRCAGRSWPVRLQPVFPVARTTPAHWSFCPLPSGPFLSLWKLSHGPELPNMAVLGKVVSPLPISGCQPLMKLNFLSIDSCLQVLVSRETLAPGLLCCLCKSCGGILWRTVC